MFNFFRMKPQDPALAARTPPGQAVTQKWPVLQYGSIPKVAKDKWSLRLFGLIEGDPVTIDWDGLMALPQMTTTEDIHCVTRWSRLDLSFEGVPFTEVMKLVKVKPEATHVMIHAEQRFTTNLALTDLLQPNVMFAHKADGKDLEPAHGAPVRLVVPHLYFWKSAKWVRGVEFMDRDRPGFWESYGYHMRGDPWREERYFE